MQKSTPFETAQSKVVNGISPGLVRASRATKLVFFSAGFGLACWAPMVPYVKARLGATHAELGTVLLFLGLGSVFGMPTAGALVGRFGSKIVIMLGGLGLLFVLPMMALASNSIALGAALSLFGLCLGAVDVAVNIHGTEVQNRVGKPLMSGFHGLYSVGGLVGAAAMTFGLSFGVNIVISAFLASVIIFVCIASAVLWLLPARATEPGKRSVFVMPHGIVIVLGIMALLIFLVEGAVLDWGAVLLSEYRNVPVGQAGAGYVVFALTMTLARLVGDRFVQRIGNRMTLLMGALLMLVGLGISALGENITLILFGFGMAGFGAANIVPVLFSLAGTQTMMPSSHAIALTSTFGYLGVFLGPVIVGYVAAFAGLPLAFGALAALMAMVAVLSGIVTQYVQYTISSDV